MRKNHFIMIIIIIILIIIAIISYNATNKLAFSQENLNNTNKKVKIFTEKFNDKKNGIYLYDDGSNRRYLFLNGNNVENGNEDSYFTDIKMEVKEGTLIINFTEKYTYDYKNKTIDSSVLYKIKVPKDVDTIRIYKNGQETHFDCIYINS